MSGVNKLIQNDNRIKTGGNQEALKERLTGDATAEAIKVKEIPLKEGMVTKEK